jgi:tetratricopeptide (TPR) repeat protein
VWTAYLPHAMHVVDVPEVSEAEGRISLLERVGYCEQTLGRYRAAERAHGQVLEGREYTLGKEHPDTLASMNNVAQALSGQGKYAEAEAMHRETLALREVSGKEHPHTLTSMHNLALALSDQGKYEEAEAMHRETLALREKVLGKEHPDTLASVSCLAYTLQHQHQYEEALLLYKRACTGYLDVLGPNHPTTRACLDLYASAQHLADALPSANERHELTDAISNSVHLAPQSSSTAELASRPRTRKRRRLKK